ncbi:MAG: response regulator transcription factor [Turneriella sp.]|nr:response regulator transcription factor [Turneriella sp.]
MYRVVIVEDKADIAEMLCGFFSDAGDFMVSRVFGNLTTARSGFDNADVAILDLLLPDGSGIDLIPVLQERSPGIKILMYTVVEDTELMLNAMTQGAHGYLLKETPPAKMLDFVRAILQGGVILSPAIAETLLGLQKKKPGANILTPRETEVLRNLTLGLTANEISRAMDCAPTTIKKHLENIYRKINVNSKSGAILFGIESGILRKM